MAMTDEQQALVALLFSSYPTFQSGDADTALTAYEYALAEMPEEDVRAAFQLLLHGAAPGQNPSYAPPGPYVAALVRGIRDKRLGEEERQRSALLQIESRGKTVKTGTPEERAAFVREQMKRFIVGDAEGDRGTA